MQKGWLTEGLLIAALPALAYYSAYHYEVGYLTYFGAPAEFAKISTETFFEALKVLVGGLWFMILIINLGLTVWPEEKRQNFRLFIPLFVMVILLMLPVVFWTSLNLFLWIAGVIGFFAFLEYIVPLWGREGRSYIENLRHSAAGEVPIAQRGLFGKMVGQFGWWNLLAIIGVFMIVPALFTIAGAHAATTQKDFLSVTYEGKEFLLLKIIDEHALFVAAADLESGTKDKNFFVQSVDVDEVGNLRSFSRK